MDANKIGFSVSRNDRKQQGPLRTKTEALIGQIITLVKRKLDVESGFSASRNKTNKTDQLGQKWKPRRETLLRLEINWCSSNLGLAHPGTKQNSKHQLGQASTTDCVFRQDKGNLDLPLPGRVCGISSSREFVSDQPNKEIWSATNKCF